MKIKKIYQKNRKKLTNQKKYGTGFILLTLLVSVVIFSTLINELPKEDNNNEINKNNLKSAPLPPPPKINIALNRPCWAGSEAFGYNKTYANDGLVGDSLNGWMPEFGILTSWWRVNFTRLSKFDNVTLYFQEESYMGNFSILVSNSSSFSGEEIEVASSINNNQLNWTTSFPMVKAMYLQLNGAIGVDASYPEFFVNEIEVYGEKSVDSITVTYPFGTSVIWENETTHYINWTSTGSIAFAMIDLYWKGTFNITISPSTTNNGSYLWTLPPGLDNSTFYQVKISDVSNSSVYDYSDNFEIFTPPPITHTTGDSITVTNPFGTSVRWENETTHYINWTSTGSNAFAMIDLYWKGTFNITISPSTTNNGSYLWTLPPGLDTGIMILWL